MAGTLSPPLLYLQALRLPCFAGCSLVLSLLSNGMEGIVVLLLLLLSFSTWLSLYLRYKGQHRYYYHRQLFFVDVLVD